MEASASPRRAALPSSAAPMRLGNRAKPSAFRMGLTSIAADGSSAPSLRAISRTRPSGREERTTAPDPSLVKIVACPTEARLFLLLHAERSAGESRSLLSRLPGGRLRLDAVPEEERRPNDRSVQRGIRHGSVKVRPSGNGLLGSLIQSNRRLITVHRGRI